MRSYSLYIHIPFCARRCAYCDFNTYAGKTTLIPEYIQALCAEIQAVASKGGFRPYLHTVYFGGGTPSLVSVSNLASVFRAIHDAFELDPEAEITLEANPGSLTLSYLSDLARLGVNRLSLGMQSADRVELQMLGRDHTVEDVVRGVEWARAAGIAQVSLDLLFGLPNQTMESWKESLSQAVALQPDHLSLYSLTLEPGTRLTNQVSAGCLAAPDDDLAAEMYEWAIAFLGQYGYVQYEISNWAQAEGHGSLKACRHNLQYWRNQPYFGVGAGAHGYIDSMRTANVLSPEAYIQRYRNAFQGDPSTYPRTFATASVRQNRQADDMAETMLMGLRLTQEGVSNSAFRQRFGSDLETVYGEEIAALIELGLLEWHGESRERLRLTARGRLLANQVFLRFI